MSAFDPNDFFVDSGGQLGFTRPGLTEAAHQAGLALRAITLHPVPQRLVTHPQLGTHHLDRVPFFQVQLDRFEPQIAGVPMQLPPYFPAAARRPPGGGRAGLHFRYIFYTFHE